MANEAARPEDRGTAGNPSGASAVIQRSRPPGDSASIRSRSFESARDSVVRTVDAGSPSRFAIWAADSSS